MARWRTGLLFAALSASSILAVNPARADAIDGDWCDPRQRQMSIKGPAIVTPGGVHMSGNYSRHAFSYTAPPAEPDAGRTIYMVLVNEDTIHLGIDNAPGTAGRAPAQVWRRCPPAVSMRAPWVSVSSRQS